jgi:hypothetical protein
MKAYMLDAIVGDASNFDLAVVDGVLDGSPAVKTGFLAAVRRMQEEKVNVTQTALFD